MRAPLLLVLAATACRHETAQVDFVRPIAGGAIVTGSSDLEHGWIWRVNPDGAVVWRRTLPGKPEWGASPIVAGTTVIVRSLLHGHDQAIAFGLDGRERWRTDLGYGRRGKAPPVEVGGDVALVTADRLQLLDVSSGRIVRTVPSDGFIRHHVIGDRLFIQEEDHWVVVAADVTPLTIDASPESCVAGGRLVAAHGGQLASWGVDGSMQPILPIGGDFFSACGETAAGLVVITNDPETHVTTFRLIDAGGAVIKSFEIPGDTALYSLAQSVFGDGTLPRFVPIDASDRMTLIDLQTFAVARTSRVVVPGALPQLLGDHWILGNADRVVSLDANTGELVAGVGLAHHRPGSITAVDRVWLVWDDERPIDHPHVVSLDPVTLAGGGAETHDETAAVRAELAR